MYAIIDKKDILAETKLWDDINHLFDNMPREEGETLVMVEIKGVR